MFCWYKMLFYFHPHFLLIPSFRLQINQLDPGLCQVVMIGHLKNFTSTQPEQSLPFGLI